MLQQKENLCRPTYIQQGMILLALKTKKKSKCKWAQIIHYLKKRTVTKLFLSSENKNKEK